MLRALIGGRESSNTLVLAAHQSGLFHCTALVSGCMPLDRMKTKAWHQWPEKLEEPCGIETTCWGSLKTCQRGVTP